MQKRIIVIFVLVLLSLTAIAPLLVNADFVRHSRPFTVFRNTKRFITNENYDKFCELIEWRRTNCKPDGPLTFRDEKVDAFFNQHNVLDSESFFIYAVEKDGEFVGYINAIMIPKPDPRLGLMYVDELWVPEMYRNHGYASMLMDAVVKKAKEMGLWRMRLYVSTDNVVARNYYAKNGYVDLGSAQCCEIELNKIFI